MGVGAGPCLGLYGGAFDPPHLAHVAMARAFVAQCGLQRLFVMPTGEAWHKPTRLSPTHHRLAMAQLAFAGVPEVVVDDRELRRPGASFTIDTLMSLAAEHPGAQWHLLIGQDQWARFTDWYRWQAIAEIASLVVANRSINTSASGIKDDVFFEGSAWPQVRAQPLNWQPLPLSSTQVRAAWAAGSAAEFSAHTMVPPAVARYISQHLLYTNTTP